MKFRIFFLISICTLLVGGCQPDVCEPGSITYVADATSLPDTATVLESGLTDGSTSIQIGKKTVEVDRVIHGPLCNDHWSGKIYVDCDVQIVAWTEEEGVNFLENCDLVIDPGTIVYVAAHNNAAYYKGCNACH